LPLAEFTYNNTPSSTTNVSPFFANKGYHPRLDIQPNRSPYPALPLSDAACYYLSNLEKIHTQLKHSIANAQTRYKKSADNRRSPAPEIKVNDCVFVLAKFIKTTCPSKKLSEKFLGPFKVSDRLGLHFYRVKLPDHLKAIHPVFHVSQLKPASPNQIPNRIEPPPSRSNWTVTSSLRSCKSSTPNLTSAGGTPSFTTCNG